MSYLVDVTDIDVTPEEAGSAVTGAGSDIDTFQELVTSFDDADKLGWYLTLQNHPLDSDGTPDTDSLIPAERVVSSQALLGGVLLTTTFLPGTDTCTDVGNGRLYGMNYKTGTADPSLSYFGTTIKSGKEVVSRSTDLGPGLPAAPSLHVGDGSGKRKLRACVQTSTGAIICHDITTLKDVLSGEVSWREPLNK
jgi:type IV pilus assembly protein PilY1